MGNCLIVLRLFFCFTLCYIGNIVSEKFHITISSMKVMLIFIRTLKLASAVKRLKGRILHVNADQKRLYSTLLRNSLKNYFLRWKILILPINIIEIQPFKPVVVKRVYILTQVEKGSIF